MKADMLVHGLLLLSCYSLLAYELARTEKTRCPPCQRKIIAGYWKFAAICMEITTIAGLLASVSPPHVCSIVGTDGKGVGLSFALNLTSTSTGVEGIDSGIGYVQLPQ